jgi:RNA polymerase sigma-70 factor (ECF subfamily)
MGSESDQSAEWMRRLQAGDEGALNALMHRWQKPLVAFAQRYTGSWEDACDVAQETFVRVYENRGRYRPRARFSTWLFTIAANLCRNQVRWRARHPTVPLLTLDQAPSAAQSWAVFGSDNALSNDVAGAVREYVQALPHDLKTVILLFEYEEFSQGEIARILGCSVKAVESRLYRARRLLKERLSRWQLSSNGERAGMETSGTAEVGR